MAKRIMASALGTLALAASVVGLAHSIEGLDDFWNPAVPLYFAIIGEVLMVSMTLAATGFGVRFLFFRIASAGCPKD
jgi:hypothetical protein